MHQHQHLASIEALTTLQLCWTGHGIRMTDARIPKPVLCSQLQNGRRAPGGQRKCFSDTFKASLAKCSIPIDAWESLAQDSPSR
eukprot:g18598.t1